MNSAAMSRNGGSAAIGAGSRERTRACLGDAQRPPQSTSLVQELGDPVHAPEQSGEQTGHEREHEREAERRRNARKRELDVDTLGVHRAHEQGGERSEGNGEVEEESCHGTCVSRFLRTYTLLRRAALR